MLFTAFWVDDDFNLLNSRATKWYPSQAEAIKEAQKYKPKGDVFLVTSQAPNPMDRVSSRLVRGAQWKSLCHREDLAMV